MPLARLRLDLEFMPSPDENQPGLMVRDPMRYSDAVLLIPPPLIPCLAMFDGETSELDLQHALFEALGDLRVGEVKDNLISALDQAGFLENETFAEIRDGRYREFAEETKRWPTHIGPGGYPEDPAELRTTFDDYFRGRRPSADESTQAIAAPHVSPFGGWESYADAYSAIPASAVDKTFVILGTSHHGPMDQFGLTRKPFVTPYGETLPALDLINELEQRGGPAVAMEDYCHSIEHSIEFQVVFLQHWFGPQIKVLPILVGSYARSIYQGGMPEDNEDVKRFLETLGNLAAREGSSLFWTLGIDMAHMGRRYGDSLQAEAQSGEMLRVEARDRDRIERVSQQDAAGFWERVQENRDDLKWCGSAPLYTFLRARPDLSGELLRYQQWNIDPQSVVSFAAMRFQ